MPEGMTELLTRKESIGMLGAGLFVEMKFPGQEVKSTIVKTILVNLSVLDRQHLLREEEQPKNMMKL